jgi:hippurate hydrolase
MDEFHKKLTAIRQAFHRDPELGFQEIRTKAKVAELLRDLGWKYMKVPGLSAFCAPVVEIVR